MQNYIQGVVSALILAGIFWGILTVSMIRDRSRYRNCTFLLLALLSLIPLITALAGPYTQIAVLVIFVLAGLLILMVPVLLIYNGFVMMRREGKRFKNLLSLLFGLFIALGEVSAFLVVWLPQIRRGPARDEFRSLPLLLILISVSAAYFSLCFLSFTAYSWFLQRIPRRRDFDYIIVLGAGLIDGSKISRLLAQRLDKAIEVWKKDPTPPVMIPSGGQGGDEKIPEGRAMAEYLIAHGIPQKSVISEERSRTTSENLKFSRELIRSDIAGPNPMHVSGRPYVAIVTSNYHVCRALRYARRMDFRATGIGSPVAAYYWPSALIREFAAIHAEKKHAVIFLAGWLLCLLPFIVFAVG